MMALAGNMETRWLTKERLFILAVSGVFVAISIFALIPVWFTDPTNWPSVEGSIQQTSVSASRSGKRARRYGLRVKYEYQVGDRTYTNSRVTLTTSTLARSSSRQHLEQIGQREYPPGHKVRVYYDPQKPARAVLDPNLSGGLRAGLAVAVGFSFLVFLAALFGRLTTTPRRGRTQHGDAGALAPPAGAP
jgi:hypothetical protein